MGGYGSGRWGWHSKKRTTDSCLSFDIAKLYRKGLLRPNTTASCTSTWSSGSSISFELHTGATDGYAKMLYSYKGGSMHYPVQIATTVPRFGGLRWWWLCPWCHRRARYLYLNPRNGRFECRLCCGLTYRSAQEHNKTLDRYMKLPPQALAQMMNGNGRESFQATMAFMERGYRMMERIGRWAGVLDPERSTSGDCDKV